MSAISRLLFALGWISPPEQDLCWGERPPVKPSERRSSPRHPATSNEAYIGWWVGEEFHSVAAQFRDIRSGGALILTLEAPTSKHVWIGLAKPVVTRWCPVRVVRERETSVGLIEIGLAFEASCDSVLLKVLVQRDPWPEDLLAIDFAGDSSDSDALLTRNPTPPWETRLRSLHVQGQGESHEGG